MSKKLSKVYSDAAKYMFEKCDHGACLAILKANKAPIRSLEIVLFAKYFKPRGRAKCLVSLFYFGCTRSMVKGSKNPRVISRVSNNTEHRTLALLLLSEIVADAEKARGL